MTSNSTKSTPTDLVFSDQEEDLSKTKPGKLGDFDPKDKENAFSNLSGKQPADISQIKASPLGG